MAKPVSQSRTEWVKKGTVVNGETVKKGYVAQKGRPEKRITNRVKLEVDTPKRGKTGDVVRLKQGAYVKKKSAPTKGGSGSGGSGRSGGSGGSGGGGSKGNYKTAPRMGKPGQYQAGAGMTARKTGSSGTVTSAIAAGNKMGPSGSSYKPKPKTPVQRAMSSNSGYVRGVKGSQAQIDAMKGKGTLKGNLAKKRAEDTKNDTRNALVIAGLAAAPFAGAKLAAGGMAARGAAAIAARGAGKTVAKTAGKTVAKRPRPATKTPAWTKYGKDIKITRNARDRAQQARLDKFMADRKAAATKTTKRPTTRRRPTTKKK